MSQEVRSDMGTLLLKLTIKELFEWRFMQTDPNWGNFLYDEASGGLTACFLAGGPQWACCRSLHSCGTALGRIWHGLHEALNSLGSMAAPACRHTQPINTLLPQHAAQDLQPLPSLQACHYGVCHAAACRHAELD